MSLHINASSEDIAECVLLPGDPLRAEFIANEFLDDAYCYNRTRNMLGFTGYFKGQRISVQGTGMGLPSLGIYINELIDEYGVKNLVRVGSCGAYQENVKIRDIIIPMSASCESNFLQRLFPFMSYAPTADFSLLKKAYDKALKEGINPHMGNILSSDQFYSPHEQDYLKWAEYGVLAVEMESAMLYTLAALKNCHALSILTVSDSLVTGESTDAKEREKGFYDMVNIALACF